MSVVNKAQQLLSLYPNIESDLLREKLRELGCSKSSVNRVIRRFKDNGELIDRRIYNSAPKKLTQFQRQVISFGLIKCS